MSFDPDRLMIDPPEESNEVFLERMAEWKDGSPCAEKSWSRLLSLARRGAGEEAMNKESLITDLISSNVMLHDSLKKASDRIMELVSEIEMLRAEDEAIRAEFGGKRDGRPTIECLREAFHAKWSEEETLFKETLNMKTEELRAEVARLKEEIEKIRAALRPFAEARQGNWSQQPDNMKIEAGSSEHDLRMHLRLGDFRKAEATLESGE